MLFISNYSKVQKKFSSDTRMECDLIGGSPGQDLEECFIGTSSGCEAFTEQECEYDGVLDDELSPVDGQIKSPLECEQLCRLYQVILLVNKQNLECLLVRILVVLTGFLKIWEALQDAVFIIQR